MKQNALTVQPFFAKFLVTQHESHAQDNTSTLPGKDGPVTLKYPSDGDDNPPDAFSVE